MTEPIKPTTNVRFASFPPGSRYAGDWQALGVNTKVPFAELPPGTKLPGDGPKPARARDGKATDEEHRL